MPWDQQKEIVATLGTTGDIAYSNTFKSQTELGAVLSFTVATEVGDSYAFQPQLSLDGVIWTNHGSALTAAGEVILPRCPYYRVAFNNTQGTPTGPIFATLTLASFVEGEEAGITSEEDRVVYSSGLEGGLADTLLTERANITIFGDSITNMGQGTFMGYGFHRTWRPERFAGQIIQPTTGAANVNGYIVGGPSNQSTESSFHVSTYSSNAPDPEMPDTVEDVEFELQSKVMVPHAPGTDIVHIKAKAGHTGSATNQVLMYRANPYENKWSGAGGEPPALFVGKSQTHSVDTYIAQTDHRFSALIYSKQSGSLIRVWPRNWSSAATTNHDVTLSQGYNILRFNTGQDGNFNAGATNYHEIFSRMNENDSISIMKIKDDSVSLAGISIDYIGGGGWETFDHVAEDTDTAQGLAFNYSGAYDSLDGTRKTYYMNEPLQQALKFHETNIAMIWLGQNDEAADDYFGNLEKIIDRIETNAAVVGLAPKILLITPYLTAGTAQANGIKLRRMRQQVIDLAAKRGVAHIDLQQMILDKHGEFADWSGTYLADGIHPNADGAAEFAELIWNAVEKAKTI